jgi:hypothetical protein
MSDPKNLVDRVLDLMVFAPVGAFVESKELLPKLIETGREYLVPQVRTARMVGQFAVAKGEQEAERAFVRLRDNLTSTGADLVNGMTAPADPDAPVAEAPPTGHSVVDASIGPEDRPEVDALAIPSYDTLAASQVISRLEGLNAVELEEVRRYELSHRARKTVLAKIAQLQAH